MCRTVVKPTVTQALRRVSSMARTVLVDVLYPKVCPGCGLRGPWLCELCQESVPQLHDEICTRCGLPLVDQHRCRMASDVVAIARAAYPYTGWPAAAVRRFKYGGEPTRANDLALRMLPMLEAFDTIDVVVPVPLHHRKMDLRGYNQSALLADLIANRAGLRLVPLLIRTRATRAQVTLDRRNRHENVAGAFSPNPEWVSPPGQRILLIDDVRTTGATTEACATVLVEQAGAQSVSVLTFAQEVPQAELQRWMQSVNALPSRR